MRWSSKKKKIIIILLTCDSFSQDHCLLAFHNLKEIPERILLCCGHHTHLGFNIPHCVCWSYWCLCGRSHWVTESEWRGCCRESLLGAVQIPPSLCTIKGAPPFHPCVQQDSPGPPFHPCCCLLFPIPSATLHIPNTDFKGKPNWANPTLKHVCTQIILPQVMVQNSLFPRTLSGYLAISF